MNRNRKIIIVAALGIVAVAVTTGWSIMASSADWPPAPYQIQSMTGTWAGIGDPAADVQSARVIWTMGAEDPVSGKGTWSMTFIVKEWTQGGQIPADYWTPALGTYARTGPNTWTGKTIGYHMKNTQPKPTLVGFTVRTDLFTMTAPDALEDTYTLEMYSPDQDLNRNGLPDDGVPPVMKSKQPATDHLKPL
jgi:hypothetical protein